MSIARVTELSATSEQSFEDAIQQAIARATKTLRGVEGCWVKGMNVMIEVGKPGSWASRICSAIHPAGTLRGLKKRSGTRPHVRWTAPNVVLAQLVVASP
jgi:flavin-binding protein dodecin